MTPLSTTSCTTMALEAQEQLDLSAEFMGDDDEEV